MLYTYESSSRGSITDGYESKHHDHHEHNSGSRANCLGMKPLRRVRWIVPRPIFDPEAATHSCAADAVVGGAGQTDVEVLSFTVPDALWKQEQLDERVQKWWSGVADKAADGLLEGLGVETIGPGRMEVAVVELPVVGL